MRHVTDKYPYIRTLMQIQVRRLGIRNFTDVGAYLGGSSLHIAQTFRRVEVNAIEPSPVHCDHLRKRSGDLSNYSVHQFAVTNENGQTYLDILDEEPNVSASVCSDNGVLIKCRTLDSIGWQPDALVINCEGSEYSIFDHAPSLKVIRQTKLIDLSLHGKSFKYTTEEYANKKLHINNMLLNFGFRTIYGKPIDDISTLPKGHIRQVWVRG